MKNKKGNYAFGIILVLAIILSNPINVDWEGLQILLISVVSLALAVVFFILVTVWKGVKKTVR